MGERQPARAERDMTPKDVFARSNMPSRWERLTNVAPKTAPDRMYLAFVAARYRGDKLLPFADELVPPDDFYTRSRTMYAGLPSVAVGLGLTVVGLAAYLAIILVVGLVILACAIVAVTLVVLSTQPAISRFHAQKARCERAEARLHADPMDPEDTVTVNEMINHDEGTLAYCAAKIASEIEQDRNWGSPGLDLTPIDLWDELAEVGESARQIAEDRIATRSLERSRVGDDPDVKVAVEEDKRLMKEALTLLAGRVSAFADYRDRLHRMSITATRDKNALSRAVRRVSDEQARDRLL